MLKNEVMVIEMSWRLDGIAHMYMQGDWDFLFQTISRRSRRHPSPSYTDYTRQSFTLFFYRTDRIEYAQDSNQ